MQYYDKETGDRYDIASGCLFFVCLVGMLVGAVAVGVREVKKVTHKDTAAENTSKIVELSVKTR